VGAFANRLSPFDAPREGDQAAVIYKAIATHLHGDQLTIAKEGLDLLGWQAQLKGSLGNGYEQRIRGFHGAKITEALNVSKRTWRPRRVKTAILGPFYAGFVSRQIYSPSE
jgi:hypothetical protein